MTIGTSSLTAAFLGEPLFAGSGDVTLMMTAVAGTLLLVREFRRNFAPRRSPDTFDRYRDARRAAQGRAVA